MRRLMEQAEEINKDRAELGEEVAQKLLEQCMENMRALLKVEAQQKAHKSSLAGLRTELPQEVVPAELQRLFESSLKRHTAANAGKEDVEQRREMVKLRALMTGEGGADEMDEGGDEDEDVVMTQQTITNIKCPILQTDMQASGELRPVTPKTGHAQTCVFSYKGIIGLIGNNRSGIPCPQHGARARKPSAFAGRVSAAIGCRGQWRARGGQS